LKAFLRRRLSDVRQTAALLARTAKTKTPRLAYVGGWLGCRNLGDEALLTASKELFSPVSVIELPLAECCRSVCSCARALRLFDHVSLSGGTRIFRSPAALECARRGFRVAEHRFVFGTGVGDPSFWGQQPGWADQRREWVKILRECSYIGVRGPLSARFLADEGLGGVEVIGDPILTFAMDAHHPYKHMPNTLGLNVGTARPMWANEKHLVQEFIDLAKMARRSHWEVSWFVVWPEDLQITRAGAEASGTCDRIYQVYTDHRAYLDLVKPISVFVGMKLHGVALATCAYVPSLMVEYRPKCRDYMLAINQGDKVVRADLFRSEQAWEQVQHWNNCREEVSLKLCKVILPLRERQRQRAQMLLRSP